MDIERPNLEAGGRITFEPSRLSIKPNLKPKSSMRIQYEAERDVLRKQLGSLDEIRHNLGLTQRKMTQLLMVDPSAWTRWVKDESKVPPHIYRALQWYIHLIEKKPEWDPRNSFQPYLQTNHPKLEKKWDELQITMESQLNKWKSHYQQIDEKMSEAQSQWAMEKHQLEEKIERKDVSLTIWKLIVLLHSCALIFGLLWSFL